MRTRPLALFLAVCLLVLALPASGDHTPNRLQATGGAIPEPVQPLGDPGRIVLDVSVPCQDDERATVRTQATPSQHAAYVQAEPTAVENRSSQVCHDANDTLAVGLPVEIGLTQEAPAFQDTQVSFDVDVQKNHTNGSITRLGPVQANVTLTPGYFNLYNVHIDQSTREAGPDEAVSYPVTIENFSNGPTEFTFELANEDALPSGFQPVVPSKLVLESEATGGAQTNGTATFQVFTPFQNGYVNEIGSIQLTVHSAYAPDPSIEGSSSQVSALTKVSGFYIPGPGVAAVAATLAGLAAATRRSPRD